MKLMAGRADAVRAAHQLLDAAVADAWRGYLETCRAAVSYDTVEPFAWARLTSRLAALDRRRRSLTTDEDEA